MTRTVKLNYPSDPRFARDMWKCWHCTKMDSQSHIMICEGYENIRGGGGGRYIAGKPGVAPRTFGSQEGNESQTQVQYN